MIRCLRCNKQYIGETKRRLKDRFNEHRRPVDRPTPSSRPTAVSDHFLSDNHSPNDLELIPLELIHSSRDALRKARAQAAQAHNTRSYIVFYRKGSNS